MMGSYLEEQIYQKMKNEQDAFLAELKTKSKNEIISHAQEITVRENILYLFSEPGRYTQQELNVLLFIVSSSIVTQNGVPIAS